MSMFEVKKADGTKFLFRLDHVSTIDEIRNPDESYLEVALISGEQIQIPLDRLADLLTAMKRSTTGPIMGPG